MITVNFDPFPKLTAERLVLRQLTLEDAPAMLRLRSDDRVVGHLSVQAVSTLEEAEAFIKKMLDGTANNEWINWAICRKDDPYMMGTYVIWHISTQSRRGEIGYMLQHDFWGKGYVQEATSAVLSYAFNQLQFHALEAWTNAKNERSVRLLQRNGFEREALLKDHIFNNNKFQDTAIYTLINPAEEQSAPQSLQNIIDCYDKSAEAYAIEFSDELSKKHLDRLLLTAFAGKVNSPIADFGCGPGQTTRFLKDGGVEDIIGVDLSPRMVAVASKTHVDISFRRGNMLDLDFPDDTFGGAIAFYAIVHFTAEQLKTALSEIYRVLSNKGQFLFSFHIGTGTVHHDEFLGSEVNIDFYFFETEKVVDLAKQAGFAVIDIIERKPYEGVEYPSKRAYIWLKKSI